MTRVALPLVLALPLAAAAAPAPKDRPPVHYFPTAVGAEWVYSVRSATSRDTAVREERVTAVDRAGGALLVTVERKGDGRFPVVSRFEVTDRGVVKLAAGDQGEPAPLCRLLRLPARPGDRWERGGLTVTTVGEEEVEVPAGTFRAIRVEGSGAEEPFVITAWYAPNVGLVQKVYRARGTGGQEGELTYSQVLKSFKPGPK